MGRPEIIRALEEERNSRLVVYLTGDRHPFTTRVAGDVVPLLDAVLEETGPCENLSLFLYTTGGDMLAPLRIVKLLRSRARRLEVIVPYRAHSAGTLIALGADLIVMGRLGELSPVDPRTGHPFNPDNPANPKAKMEISVEDLNSYFLLAREAAGVPAGQMTEVYRLLVEKIHPLSLGNAYRAHRMARTLTGRLLETHMDRETQSALIEKIIDELTSNIAIHTCPIDRGDAAALGLPVEEASDSCEKLMRSLLASYREEMKLGQPFSPAELLKDRESTDFQVPGAFLESAGTCYEFRFRGRAQKLIRDNKPVLDMNIGGQAWVRR